TNLSGFGLWVQGLGNHRGIEDGVEVLHRTDNNYFGTADAIKDTILSFSSKPDEEITEIRQRASELAEQALWKHFIVYYYKAYDTALRNVVKKRENGEQSARRDVIIL
ncbi:Glycogen synthase, partial [termite gut metagenome]